MTELKSVYRGVGHKMDGRVMTEVQIAYRDHGCKEDVRRMTALKRAWRGDGRSMQRSESSCSRQEEKVVTSRGI